MSLGDSIGWVYSMNYAPIEVLVGYVPDVPENAKNPWIRLNVGTWYAYWQWTLGVPVYTNAPKAYLAQRLLQGL
jgi:hypothetical protein